MAFSHPNECGSIFFHRYKIVKLCIPIGIRMVDAGLPLRHPAALLRRSRIFRLNLISVRCLLNAQIFPDRSLEFQGLLSENNCETGVLQNHSLYLNLQRL